ncbi:MAG: AbgT family transporter [Bacteroidales bacterium]|nr:AbgT family transporter [Bacteroidales bacterium]
MKKIFQKAGVLSKINFQRALDYVEVIDNKLPHPATLFALLAFLVVIISSM